MACAAELPQVDQILDEDHIYAQSIGKPSCLGCLSSHSAEGG